MISHKQNSINGIKIIDLHPFYDDRGVLVESYKKRDLLINTDFCQDNLVNSNYSCLRGLHFQSEPFAQSKLITVIKGKIQDVALDIRESSSTFGHYFSIVLSEDDFKQIFIPKGFAHGFLTLSKTSTVHYKMDNIYKPDHQSGIAFNDEDLNIDWAINHNEIIVSDKDRNNPKFSEIQYFK